MNNQLYIPKKLMVGYNRRGDTYSDLLGYVIYYDEKGVLRKEDGWRKWIARDARSGLVRRDWNSATNSYDDVYDESKKREPLPPDAFDNVPTEGFVLNKNVGGGSRYSWHNREAKCRVWDPRGFEIEIDFPNLLFILQETNSIKGKGLEGEFVYAWEGKDLQLLPVSCQEYQNSIKFTELKEGKVSVKELVPGYSYETKQQKILTYLGKFQAVYKPRSYYDYVDLNKYFIFVDKDNNYVFLENVSSISKLSNDTVISTFAELIEGLSKNDDSPNILDIVKTPVSYDSSSNRASYYYGNDDDAIFDRPFIEESDGTFTQYKIYAKTTHDDPFPRYDRKYKTIGFKVVPVRKLIYANGVLTEKKISSKVTVENTPVTPLIEIQKMNFIYLSVKVNSGKVYKINN